MNETVYRLDIYHWKKLFAHQTCYSQLNVINTKYLFESYVFNVVSILYLYFVVHPTKTHFFTCSTGLQYYTNSIDQGTDNLQVLSPVLQACTTQRLRLCNILFLFTNLPTRQAYHFNKY